MLGASCGCVLCGHSSGRTLLSCSFTARAIPILPPYRISGTTLNRHFASNESLVAVVLTNSNVNRSTNSRGRYCAPERARASGHGESCLATKASDIWSVGMVLYWLLTGQVTIRGWGLRAYHGRRPYVLLSNDPYHATQERSSATLIIRVLPL